MKGILQSTHPNFIFNFPVFSPFFFLPVGLQIFPVLIYVICDYYIHKTDLADFLSSKINWKF